MSSNKRLIALVLFLAGVLGGLLVATALIGGSPTPSATVTPSPTAVASPSATIAPTESTPSTPSPSPLPPSPSTSPVPSASSAPTTPPGPPASITFTQLKLDATDDPAGLDRVISFQSQGAGTITVKYTSLSPQGTTQACLIAGAKTLGCRSAASGTLTAVTTSPTVAFKVTLRGVGMFTPTVEVAVTFPASTPAVTIANARFDGTAYPDTNGIQALVVPRADGVLHLLAGWGGHPFLYEVDLMEQGGSGGQTLANQGPSTNVDTTLPVTGSHAWKLVLQNIETGFGITGLTATVSWP